MQTPDVREDFEQWLGEMQARHPAYQQSDVMAPAVLEVLDEGASRPNRVREAVGVFHDPAALDAAVDALGASGFDRASISVLATGAKAKDRIDRYYRLASDIEDCDKVPRAAFASRASRAEGDAALVGVPLYIGGFAGAAAVAATGGALALAVAATIAGAMAGGGLGALLATAIERRHMARVREQLEKGGLVVWVNVPRPDAETRALAILAEAGAHDIHVHEIKREWGLNEAPFANIQFDTFLESDRRAIRHTSIAK